ncbi:MAG: lysophospholipid transporter LplT [Ideonella sp.]|nr:lysophospholipid transporter LplT [Ideonella sp.]
MLPAPPRYPSSFTWMVAAQFAAALADNALLIVAMVWLDLHGHPAWTAPLLKVGFNLSFVVLAPFVGALADAWPKAAWMTALNGVKALGALAVLLGLNPLLALMFMGMATSAYAPAKLGWMTETVASPHLIGANGWLKASLVCAVLLGTGFGGWLVSPAWLLSSPAQGLQQALAALHTSPTEALTDSLCVLLLVYLGAMLCSALVCESGSPRMPFSTSAQSLLARFAADVPVLWRDATARLALLATMLFWGIGAVLQFAVLRWAHESLGLAMHEATYLQASVALGVMAGALAAGRWVRLEHAAHLLWAGMGLAGLLALLPWAPDWQAAAALLTLAGAAAGLMVVPLNALLHRRGHQLLGAGAAIAVQGFFQNASVLAALGLYMGLLNWAPNMNIVLTAVAGMVAVATGRLLTMSRGRLRPAPTEGLQH